MHFAYALDAPGSNALTCTPLACPKGRREGARTRMRGPPSRPGPVGVRRDLPLLSATGDR
jgi:hypothetical protein